MKFILLLGLFITVFRRGQADENEGVEKAFKKNEIVEDVIHEAPKELLHLTWGEKHAQLGNELTPTEVREQPAVLWRADRDKLYVLAMVDPDEFNRKEHTEREFKHWLVGNIPGNDVHKGDVLAAYIGSGPPEDGGLHRYVFLIYAQPHELDFDEKRLPANSPVRDRVKFHIQEFAHKYKLGEPVAGNFYIAKWDKSVPALLASLDP